MLVEYSIKAEAEISKMLKVIILAKKTEKALGGLANLCCMGEFLDFLELGLRQNNTIIIPSMANSANSSFMWKLFLICYQLDISLRYYLKQMLVLSRRAKTANTSFGDSKFIVFHFNKFDSWDLGKKQLSNPFTFVNKKLLSLANPSCKYH